MMPFNLLFLQQRLATLENCPPNVVVCLAVKTGVSPPALTELKLSHVGSAQNVASLFLCGRNRLHEKWAFNLVLAEGKSASNLLV